MVEMALAERAREERREYFRQWRAKNKDKVRESNRRYWERRPATGSESRSTTCCPRLRHGYF